MEAEEEESAWGMVKGGRKWSWGGKWQCAMCNVQWNGIMGEFDVIIYVYVCIYVSICKK